MVFDDEGGSGSIAFWVLLSAVVLFCCLVISAALAIALWQWRERKKRKKKPDVVDYMDTVEDQRYPSVEELYGQGAYMDGLGQIVVPSVAVQPQVVPQLFAIPSSVVVRVKAARDLPESDHSSRKPGVHCVVSVGDEAQQTGVRKGRSCRFDNAFRFPVPPDVDAVHVAVYEQDGGLKEPIGFAAVPLKLLETTGRYDDWVPLTLHAKAAGHLHMCVEPDSSATPHVTPRSHTPTLTDVRVTVVEATQLPSRDSFGKNDPYVDLTIGSVTRTTTVKNNVAEPTWNETFNFPLTGGEHELRVAVMDADVGGSDVIGRGTLALSALSPMPDGTLDQHIPLQFEAAPAGYLRVLVTGHYQH